METVDPETGNPPPPYTGNADAPAEKSANKAHVYTSYVKDAILTISSKAGGVKLSGGVMLPSQKPLANREAEALPWSTGGESQPAPDGADGRPTSDGWIASKINETLASNRHVSADATEVEAEDGTVTLRGEASSEAQKDLTGEYVRDIRGVREVKNEMTLAEAPGSGGADGRLGIAFRRASALIGDARITAQASMTLLFRPATRGVKTSIETTDGAVTVGGAAKNGAERDLVSKLVAGIKGVKSVANHMTVGMGEPLGG